MQKQNRDYAQSNFRRVKNPLTAIKILLMLSASWLVAGLVYGEKSEEHSSRMVDDLDVTLRQDATIDTNSRGKINRKNSEEPGNKIESYSNVFDNIEPLKRLKAFEQEINSIESNLKVLSSQVAITQQKIVNTLALDGKAYIAAKIKKSQAAQVESFAMSIDGTQVYKTGKYMDLWIPQGTLALYEGALLPGEHKIDLTVRIALLDPASLPINESLYKIHSNSFKINVPSGKSRRSWTFVVEPQSSLNDETKSTMIEGVPPA